MPYYGYWGKRKDGLTHENVYHSLDAAAVAKTYLELVPSVACRLAASLGITAEEVGPLVTFLVACHDLGKFSRSFQNRHETGDSVDHDTISFQLWEHLWPSIEQKDLLKTGRSVGKRGWQKGILQLARSVAGHHGVPPEDIYCHMISELFSPQELSMVRCYLDDLAKIVFPENYALKLPERFSRKAQWASWLLAGFVVMCDWIASDESHFGFHSSRMTLKQYWTQKAIPAAFSSISASGSLPTKLAGVNSYKKLFDYVNDDPTPLQRHAMNVAINDGPNLMILEDMTGAGKTEAACILAARMMEKGLGEGMYVALPTMATADGIYERVGKFYPKLFKDGEIPSLILSHGSNKLSEAFERSVLSTTSGARCTEWIASNKKKAFLADIGVGTVDQALLGILPSRHQSLRLFGMSKHVLVVDEVHSHDTYMHGLLRTLLKFHAAQGGSAILLSATLPAKMREELVDSFREGLGYDKGSSHMKITNSYPLYTAVGAGFQSEIPVKAHTARKHQVKISHLYRQEDLLKKLIETSISGQCACWIRNTVTDVLNAKTSVEAALTDLGVSLKLSSGEDRVTIFHARYAMGDRLAIQDQVLCDYGPRGGVLERAGRILIASQVVEQSLDLDFDVLISDLAPMDSLIQRAGRSRRHIRDAKGNRQVKGTDGRGPATMYIYGPDPDKVYAKHTDEDIALWYEDFFSGAAMVYQSHSHLWLTSQILKSRGGWKMPECARELIEGSQVYSPSLPIPDQLFLRDADADGKRLEHQSMAKQNSLRLEGGYVASQASWRNREETAPTRLGLPTVTITLVKWDGHKMEPWFDHARHPIEMSQLRTLQQKVMGASWVKDPSMVRAVEDFCHRYKKPWLAKDTIILPLREGGDGYWYGEVIDSTGAERHLHYRSDRGMSIPSRGSKKAKAA